MRSRLFRLAPAALTAGLLAASALVGTASATPKSIVTMKVAMTGAAEKPSAGDPDGSGTAILSFTTDKHRVCWDLSVANISTPVAAHIHAAPAGQAGPVVIPLTPPVGGHSSGCLEGVDDILIKNIIDNPSQYYVNVHTADYPAGALRGQLSGVDKG